MIALWLTPLLLFGLFSATKTQLVGGNSPSNAPRRPTSSSCNRGWFLFGGKCYGVGGKRGVGRLNWEKASERCKEYRGELATIHSQELQDFLRAFILMDVKENMYIGIHNRNNESIYEWVDGTTVDYTNWEPGEPTAADGDGNKEFCAELAFRSYRPEGVSGNWNDVDCNKNLEFICQKRPNRQGRRFDDPRYCPPRIGGWRHQTSCYHIVEERLSWPEAEKNCIEKYKGHLVTIRDFPARLFLEYILKNYTKNVWIGIKFKNELQQQWSSGWFVAYTNWVEDHVEFTEGACAIRKISEEWTTIPCKTPMSSICETSTENPPSLKAPAGMFCPEEHGEPSWRDLGGEFCYFFDSSNHVSWPKANFMCMRRGGTLAGIHSKVEQDILHQFLIYTEFLYWIGLYRNIQHDEEFIWVDGNPLNFTFWGADEPNSEKEQCVEVRTDTMKWNDIDCEHTRSYICSVRKVSSNQTIATEIYAPPPCNSDLNVNAPIGVLLCVLVVAALLGIIVYNFRPADLDQHQERRASRISIPSLHSDQRMKYRSLNEFIIKDDTFENST